MGKYFLGSVGKAEAFKRDANGNLTLAFVSKTLTDSSLNINVSRDEIRAGEGASVQFNFYHDPSVEVRLTDILWKREYVTAQLGAVFKSGEDDQIDYVTETLEVKNNKITLSKSIKPMPMACVGGKQYVIWYTKQGEEKWESATRSAAFTEISLPNSENGQKYCVRYLSTESKAKTARITSLIIPEELFLVVTAPIFAGDACSASKGKAAGHITFEIPRFFLNGTQEFAMNMSQNQVMSLEGVAMATAADFCDSSSQKLLRIIEVNMEETWYSDIVSLVVDEESCYVGERPVVYGVRRNGEIVRCPNNELVYKIEPAETYTAMTNSYVFVSGTYHININAGTAQSPEPYLRVDETVTIGGSTPTLVAPGLSLTDDTLTIQDMDGHAVTYSVYDGSTLLGTITKTGTNTTVDLSQYAMAVGSHTIKAKASAPGYNDSVLSEGVIYSRYQKLATTTGAIVDGHIFTVTAVANATYYDIYSNGTKIVSEKPISSLSTDLEQEIVPPQSGGTYYITAVMKSSNQYYLDSDPSEAQTYVVLPRLEAPDIQIEQGG